tara:strand:+ start:191 stop:412 length:222 start_codon:yes stop_codon:yes gene_type:complete
MSNYIIYRHPEGISLNGEEYLLDEKSNEVLTFITADKALDYVNNCLDEEDEKVSNEDELEEFYGLYIREDDDG